MTFARAVAGLDTMPGVNQRGAELWVAESGIDMARPPAWLPGMGQGRRTALPRAYLVNSSRAQTRRLLVIRK